MTYSNTIFEASLVRISKKDNINNGRLENGRLERIESRKTVFTKKTKKEQRKAEFRKTGLKKKRDLEGETSLPTFLLRKTSLKKKQVKQFFLKEGYINNGRLERIEFRKTGVHKKKIKKG